MAQSQRRLGITDVAPLPTEWLWHSVCISCLLHEIFPNLVAHTYSPNTLGLKQDDPKFEASLGFIMRLSSETKPNKRRSWAFPSEIPKGLEVFPEG